MANDRRTKRRVKFSHDLRGGRGDGPPLVAEAAVKPLPTGEVDEDRVRASAASSCWRATTQVIGGGSCATPDQIMQQVPPADNEVQLFSCAQAS